jgi:RNAse PH (EC 2.7.7.56)
MENSEEINVEKKRIDGREGHELRPIKGTRHFIKHGQGSVLIEVGDTQVICPRPGGRQGTHPFLKGQKKGWITARV